MEVYLLVIKLIPIKPSFKKVLTSVLGVFMQIYSLHVAGSSWLLICVGVYFYSEV